MKTKAVLEKIDAVFAPDVRVTLDGHSNILNYHALNERGSHFVSQRNIIGAKFDDVLVAGAQFELTFETVEI